MVGIRKDGQVTTHRWYAARIVCASFYVLSGAFMAGYAGAGDVSFPAALECALQTGRHMVSYVRIAFPGPGAHV